MWNIDGCFLKPQFRPVELQCCPVIVCKIPQRPADDLLLLRLKFLRESFLFCSKHPVYHKKYEYLFVPGTHHTLPRQWRTEPAMDASKKINLHIFLGRGRITGMFYPNLACVWVFRPSPLLLPPCRLTPQTVLEVKLLGLGGPLGKKCWLNIWQI